MLTAPHLRKLRNFAWTCFRCIYTENVGDVRWTDGMHHICHSCICLKFVFAFVSNRKMYLSENVRDVRGCVAGTDGMHHICNSYVFVANLYLYLSLSQIIKYICQRMWGMWGVLQERMECIISAIQMYLSQICICICLKFVFVFVSNWKMYLSEYVGDV